MGECFVFQLPLERSIVNKGQLKYFIPTHFSIFVKSGQPGIGDVLAQYALLYISAITNQNSLLGS